MPNQPPEPQPIKPAAFINAFYGLAWIYSMMLTPFLRSGAGTRAYGFAPITFLLLIFFAGACPNLGIYYLPCWVVMVIWRRISADRSQHSNYAGRPWLTGLICRSERIARFLEVLAVFAFGIALLTVTNGLGEFVLSIGMSMLIVLGVEVSIVATKRRQMNDAAAQMAFQARVQKGGNW